MLEHLAQKEGRGRETVTLDDLTIRELAKTDPKMFFQLHKPPLLIDEVQYAPELFPYIKMMVDSRGSEYFAVRKVILPTAVDPFPPCDIYTNVRILGGEVAIGTNYGITRHTKNILFDEKIGGSMHMAIGEAFREAGGKNESAIHWDMINDMTREGRIYADGELFYENGKFREEALG